jgi:ribulose-5-phosphate 4-epimerase/fuculose-1-phosphate aldolase
VDDIAQLKEELSIASRILANEGLAQGFGHISVRIPGTDKFLIPRSMSPALVNTEDILTFNLAGEKLEGERQPNSETWIHTCVYRARSDVACVAHTHPVISTALASAGVELKPLHNFGAVFPNGVRIFSKPGLINTEELGTETAIALGQDYGLLLRGHGAITVDIDIKRATLLAIYMEQAAQVQFYAMQLGTPLYYTPEEAAMVRNQVFAPGRNLDRAWEFYVDRLRQS